MLRILLCDEIITIQLICKKWHINSDDPKMTYTNIVEIHNKVEWSKNKIQSIMNQKYNYYILLRMLDYNSSASSYSSTFTTPRPLALRHISVSHASVIMASRTCLTSDQSGKISLSMSACAIPTMQRHLGKISWAWSNRACSSSSISWWDVLGRSLGAACTIYGCDTLKNNLMYPLTVSFNKNSLICYIINLILKYKCDLIGRKKNTLTM